MGKGERPGERRLYSTSVARVFPKGAFTLGNHSPGGPAERATSRKKRQEPSLGRPEAPFRENYQQRDFEKHLCGCPGGLGQFDKWSPHALNQEMGQTG